MNLLDRYIFKQGAVPFAFILLCTTAVIWLTQILQRVDLIVDDGGSVLVFFKVTVLLLPSLIGVIVPFALLAAVLYSANTLAVDNELSVMNAAGASRLRLARPLILLSVIAGILVLAINLDLQPRSYRLLKETIEEVRSDIAQAFIRQGVFSKIGNGVTVYAEEVRPGDQYVGLFVQDEMDPEEVKTYTAERGLFQITPTGPKLLLLRGTVQYSSPEQPDIDIVRFVETAIDLQTFRSEDIQRSRDSTERYLSELLNPDMSSEFDRKNAGNLVAEGHGRLATPLYAPALTALALAVMLTAPISRRGYAARVMIALGAAVLVRTAGFAFLSLAEHRAIFNVVQYVFPALVFLLCVGMIVGKPRRVPRREIPPIQNVLATEIPAGGGATA